MPRRTAACIDTPQSQLPAKLQRWGVAVSMGTDTNDRTLGGGGALERGHRASLERLAELGDALSGVLAVTISVEATELVGVQAVKVGVG